MIQRILTSDWLTRSEVESELEFDDHVADNETGGGEKLSSRLELPPGVTGAESCISAISTPPESYIGDSCGSFEFLPKESQLRKLRRSAEKDSPPRDIKKEIEKRAANLQLLSVKNMSANIPGEPSKSKTDEKQRRVSDEMNNHQGTAESSKSGASRKSGGSDRRSGLRKKKNIRIIVIFIIEGGSDRRSSGSDQRRKRKTSNGSSVGSASQNDGLSKLANVDEGEAGVCDSGQLRPVNNQVLLDITRDIKPPPHDPSPIRGKMKGKPGRSKDFPIGPMPNFEREIQKIIAEQVEIEKFNI